MVGVSQQQGSNRAGLALASAMICLFAVQAAQARLLPSVKARAPDLQAQRVASLPSDVELERQGARIGEIRFDARQLFDTQAADEDTTLSRLANRLHIQTRASTIQDQLLFRSGDLYRPGLLEESARILR